MKNPTLFILLLFIGCLACSPAKTDVTKALEFCSAIETQISLNNATQQKFIDKLTLSIIQLKEDNNAKFDTLELKELFEQSKSIGIQKEKNVASLHEIDNQINLKSKALDYIKAMNEAIQNEFPQFIQILTKEEDNKFDSAKKILSQKLILIKEKEIEFNKALNTFKNKYQHLSKDATLDVEGDFEFVNIKNIVLPLTEIREGTKIELLTFSGTKEFNDRNFYYCQFIGIDKASGDTLRILAASPLQIHYLDHISREGTYYLQHFLNKENAVIENEYIIFNKKQSSIETGSYKTVFGILKFD